jgi:hypothetical protein
VKEFLSRSGGGQSDINDNWSNSMALVKELARHRVPQSNAEHGVANLRM